MKPSDTPSHPAEDTSPASDPSADPASDTPLTDAESIDLEARLAACSAEAMSLETLDGFFTALHCGPDRLQPSEFLPQVWSEEPAFDSEAALHATLDRVMRHWHAVAAALQRTRDRDDPFEPRMRTDAGGRPMGNDWALGFMRGVRMRPASWRPLMQGLETGELLYPTLWLLHEHDTDAALRPPALSPERRDALVATMIASVPLIDRHFEARRKADGTAPGTLRRTGAKTGRNDACPCGSGRKFKQCCGRGGQALH